ncbi:hypothetical protein [Flavobacterium sp. UMI-01]|uniref:hypothetical protein n=1 Tax=Flavobacterium sp. UMI-01 TaxID=1441053 RepID=UPI001C7D95C1|nr:hypothetical protein [Flavobacterium sp. UMI-01]GIZ09041.1 hypothetical protein FUMI01_17680 [Flavobacterium sp. UMI-01]
MVEVYKTDIKDSNQAREVYLQLKIRFPYYEINFDLEDSDRILRVESSVINIEDDVIMDVVQSSGYYIEILSDEPIYTNSKRY